MLDGIVIEDPDRIKIIYHTQKISKLTNLRFKAKSKLKNVEELDGDHGARSWAPSSYQKP